MSSHRLNCAQSCLRIPHGRRDICVLGVNKVGLDIWTHSQVPKVHGGFRAWRAAFFCFEKCGRNVVPSTDRVCKGFRTLSQCFTPQRILPESWQARTRMDPNFPVKIPLNDFKAQTNDNDVSKGLLCAKEPLKISADQG